MMKHDKQPDSYRWEATSIAGFVQQLAVSYVAHGYWFNVSGVIPEGKDLKSVDEKLMKKYRVGVTKWTRARRKLRGEANVHYLRHGRFFVLVASHGESPFFEEERAKLKDIRRTPLKFGSYSISYRGGHACVRIERETFKDLKAFFTEIAVKRSAAAMESALRSLPFEPYAPIRSQLFILLRAVNRKRKTAGISQIDRGCLRLRRRIIRPFEKTLSGAQIRDSRHTLITELAESGAGDQTIMDIAGHVSRQMLKHYSHIRMQAKREALEAVGKKQQEAEKNKKAEEVKRTQDCSPKSADALKVEGESLQKSLQSGVSEGPKYRRPVRKSLKRIGSPRATLQEIETVRYERRRSNLLIRGPLR
jgi:hypothetical protein